MVFNLRGNSDGSFGFMQRKGVGVWQSFGGCNSQWDMRFGLNRKERGSWGGNDDAEELCLATTDDVE